MVKNKINHYIPPLHFKISLKQLEGEYWYVMDKICSILFTEEYNSFCVDKARSVLNFSLKARLLTGKQIKLIMDLKPNRKL